VQADPDQPPKFRAFNWGNQNTQLWGGGYIIESIVYDESGEIGHGPEARSPDWIKRQANLPPEVRWINESTHPSCKRRTKSFGAHFYYVSEEC
jgi:hypothetical protein